MLQTIRDKSSGWIAYVIVGLICIPFVLWGVQEYVGVGGELMVAEVNGKEISARDFQRGVQMQQQRLRDMFGGQVPPAMLEGSQMQQSVLNGMIRTEVLSQFAESAGFRASDKEITAQISSQPAFQVDGKFSQERYTSLLKQQGMSTAGYEHALRSDLQMGQFQQALSDSGFATKKEREMYLKLRDQKRDVSYFMITANSQKANVEISSEEIEKHYKEQSLRYMTPEAVKLSYISLNADEIAESVNVTDADLKDLYEQQKDIYATPETRRAAHILIKAAKGSPDATIADAKSQAESALNRINAGEDFAAVAKELSQDKLSIEKGGDLGFIAGGDMDKTFEDELFRLDLDGISEPVQTSQGFHLIKVLEIKEKQYKSFADAKTQVEQEYRQIEADRMMVDSMEQLLTLTYESPDSLAPAADALGLTVQTSDWIQRDLGEGIGSHTKIRTAAFSEVVLSEKRNSEVIELPDGQQVAIRLAEHRQAKPRLLEEVDDEIMKELLEKSAREKAKTLGEEKLVDLKALNEMKAGKTLDDLAKGMGATLTSTGLVDRKSKEMPAELLNAVFKLPMPDEVKPLFHGLQLANGDYVLLQLKSVETPAVTLDDSNKLNSEAVMADANRREFESAYRALESRAKLVVFEENLAQ